MLVRTFAAAALVTACALPLRAQAALQAAPSTRATTAVTLAYPRGQAPEGVTGPLRISIDYGQPHLRGRPLHTADLVPYDEVWRTGANEATTLTTDVDLMIGAVHVPKGSYSLFTLPSRAGWKLIINRNTGQWGTQYDAAHDLARVDLRLRTLPEPVESLAISMIPSTEAGPPHGELRLAWGTSELATDWSVR